MQLQTKVFWSRPTVVKGVQSPGSLNNCCHHRLPGLISRQAPLREHVSLVDGQLLLWMYTLHVSLELVSKNKIVPLLALRVCGYQLESEKWWLSYQPSLSAHICSRSLKITGLIPDNLTSFNWLDTVFFILILTLFCSSKLHPTNLD